MMGTRFIAAGILSILGTSVSAACPPAPEPVVSLSYGSRYQDGDASRSTLDTESNAEVDRALAPVDDFIRDLSSASNAVLRDPSDTETADCVIRQIAEWADGDGLTDLGSFTARLSVGSRISGIAFAYRNVRPSSTLVAERKLIEAWLADLVTEQITFWDEEATPGAKVGNLRGWASLATALVGDLTDNDAYRHWAAWSVTNILCTARMDGSLPQETKRGAYALHYQLHAVGALVPAVALLQQDGIDLAQVCDGALARVVGFALTDLAQEGAASADYSGQPQSLFEDPESLKPHILAWSHAYRRIRGVPPQEIPDLGEAGNSKLGGDQSLVFPERS